MRAGGKQVYQVAFSFKGVQCREVIARPHNKANETYCVRLRAEIMGKIDRNEFDYSEYFPGSERAAIFGQGVGKVSDLKTLLEAYRDRTKATLELSTWKVYRHDIDAIWVPTFGHLKITDLSTFDLRDWIGTQTVSLKRIRNMLLPLRAVINEAIEDGILKASPIPIKVAKLVPIDKRVSEYEPQPYTAHEVRRLLLNIPEPERWAFQLWAYTGLRTGELIGLRWARVDLDGKTMRVTETTTEQIDKTRAKTTAGIRTIPLLPAAMEALHQIHKFTYACEDRVTFNPRGRRKDKAWDVKRLAIIWADAHEGTGIAKRSPYELRHTFASNLLSEGENLALIARWLGHKTVEMVIKHYGRWVGEPRERSYGLTELWSVTNAVRM